MTRCVILSPPRQPCAHSSHPPQHVLRLQAPRFGNGRTITDLAKNVFAEISMRMSVSAGGADQNDHRASVADIRRSAAAILKQMTRVAPSNATDVAAAAAVVPEAAFCTGDQTPRKPPKQATRTMTTTAASPDKVSGAKRTAKERDITSEEDEENVSSGPEAFLSVEDIYVLHEACEIAGIPVDSPDLGDDANPEVEEGLRQVLLLARAEGGMGFPAERAQAFLRKLVSDRAALSLLGQQAADTDAKLASDEVHVEAAVALAERAVAEEQASSGDGELLAALMRAKRAKEAALQKAKEERERKLALEKAAQAALRRMGVCPAGYQWLREGNGWRCSAGGHYVSGSAVEAEMARGGKSS